MPNLESTPGMMAYPDLAPTVIFDTRIGNVLPVDNLHVGLNGLTKLMQERGMTDDQILDTVIHFSSEAPSKHGYSKGGHYDTETGGISIYLGSHFSWAEAEGQQDEQAVSKHAEETLVHELTHRADTLLGLPPGSIPWQLRMRSLGNKLMWASCDVGVLAGIVGLITYAVYNNYGIIGAAAGVPTTYFVGKRMSSLPQRWIQGYRADKYEYHARAMQNSYSQTGGETLFIAEKDGVKL